MTTWRRLLAGLIAAILIAPLFVAVQDAVVVPTRAAAASPAEFDPGNIISDALFFNGAAMSAGEVQSFLQAKEAGCYSGATCAYQAIVRSPNMAAESGLCDGYSGASERVADVIAKVGQACGISQRVLLVLIQKEQHLITSTNPDQWSYDQATGFACPDTAPCDSSYSGFFFQVWYAARQFKIYQLHPGWFNHLPNRWNDIRYSTDAACGTSPVWIVNQATAGLYNYTPYQPNIASLSNIYGDGDRCSTYGNRNFWTIYSGWFGPTHPANAIDQFVAANGSLGLGSAQWAIEYFTGSGGGIGQRYSGGSVLSSTTAGTWAVMNGVVRDQYISYGGPGGSFGWPTGPTQCVDGLCSQQFQGGLIGDNPIANFQAQQGGDGGILGPPAALYQRFTGNGGGLGRQFQNASVLTSPTAGTWAVMNGAIRDEYISRGGPNGALGWPTAAQVCASGVCFQTFQGGTITPNTIAQFAASNNSLVGAALGGLEYFSGNGSGAGQRYANASVMWSPSAGVWAVMNGGIRDQYIARGGPNGSLGWPVGAQTCIGAECSQTFQNGVLTSSGAAAAIAQLQASMGGNTGALGPAMAALETFVGNGGGSGQRFKNASVMYSPIAGTWAVMNGAIRDEYITEGGPNGSLGWPTAAQVCIGSVCSQVFQGGTLSPGIGAAAITAFQATMGGDAGTLGPAMADFEYFAASGGGVGQRFKNASVMYSPTAGTWAIMNGPIRDEYIARGGVSSSLGWPSAAQVCSGSTCSQLFQGGSIAR